MRRSLTPSHRSATISPFFLLGEVPSRGLPFPINTRTRVPFRVPATEIYGIRHVPLLNRKLRANCEKCGRAVIGLFFAAEEKSTRIREYLTLISDNITLIGVHTRNMIIKLNWRSLHAHRRRGSCITKKKEKRKTTRAE